MANTVWIDVDFSLPEHSRLVLTAKSYTVLGVLDWHYAVAEWDESIGSWFDAFGAPCCRPELWSYITAPY